MGVILPVVSSANYAELLGRIEYAIADHEFPLTVWTAGEAVQEQVQRSTAKLQPGISAVYMGMYASVIQMRAGVEAGRRVVVENRALQVEFQQTL